MSGTWTDVGSPTVNTVAPIGGLTPGTPYDLDVVATNTAGSAVSTTLSVTTPAGSAPSQVTGLAISVASSSSLILSWTASAGSAPISYQVQFRQTGQTAWTSFGAPISATTETITGLAASTSYDFEVVATNSIGSSTSGLVTSSTQSAGTSPAAPTGFAIGSISPTTIALSWSASASGTAPISYQIQYRVSGQTLWINFGSSSALTVGTVSGLTPGTAYDFKVVASNGFGSASSPTLSASTQVVAGTAPSIPLGVVVSAITPTSISLSWSASATGSSPISYAILYQVSGATTWISAGSPSASLSGSVSGLLPGTTYRFEVVASNFAGSSTSAPVSAATTVKPTPPSAPGDPIAWIIMPNSVSLTWAASLTGTAPVTYQIQVRVVGTTAWSLTGTPTLARSTTVEGLVAGTDYDFQVVATNSAGFSVSSILTIIAPISGGTVTSRAQFQPTQILTAAELDTEFDSKLDVAGGVVGPLQISQTATGGNQPAMLGLSRTAGGLGDAPMISSAYTAVFADGPVVGYSAIGMTLTVLGDASSNGPAGNMAPLSATLNISALRSLSAPTTGSKHAALKGVVSRVAPSGGVPAGRRLSDGSGVSSSVTDATNLHSADGGSLLNVDSAFSANGLDNAGIRFGHRFIYSEATPLGSGGMPLEISRAAYYGPSSSTSYAQVIVEMAGAYGVAGLDLRSASAFSGVITSGTPTTPVTALAVDRALSFSSSGLPAAAVSVSNPKAVSINGNAYSVVGVSLGAGGSGGVLTFASPVSVADATQGNVVVPTAAHTIWLSESANGGLPGDIAFNRSGTSRAYYDPALGFVLASGSDRLAAKSTAALTLPTGSTTQRPAVGRFGDFRANSDTNQYEVWQPLTASWVPIGSSSGSGGAPGAASSLICGSPSTNAVSVSWVAPSTGTAPFLYQVQYRLAGVSGWTNWGGAQPATSTTVAGLSANTRYDFQVVSSNAFGTSTSAVVSATTSAVTPGAPTGVAGASATSTTVTVSWTAPAAGSTPLSYLVQYRATGATPWLSSPAGYTLGLSQTITGLTAATGYDFQVLAVNVSGSTASTVATQSTSAAASVAPAAPTSVTAGSITSSSLLLSWTAPSTGTTPFSYQVQYRVTGQSTFVAFGGSVTATSETITGLQAATSYDFRVIATNSAGSATSAVGVGVTIATSAPSIGSVSGSIVSGSTSPIISGPSNAAVLVSHVVPLTGIVISDQPSTITAGTCRLTITCGLGSLLDTVSGAQVSGSGTQSVTFTNTLTECQAAAANIVYSAPVTAGTDNVVVSVTDQFGVASSISISVAISVPAAGSSPGSIPTDGTGETATQAQLVLNGFGVNTHLDQAGYQTLGLAAVENCVNYLGGIKLLRDSTTTLSDETWFPQMAQATSTKFICYVAQTDSSGFQGIFNRIGVIPTRYIAALEGCDEADTGAAVGFAETLANAASFQPTVWASGQSLGLPTIQISFGQGWSTNPATGNYGTVGNLSAVADYGNIHLFPATAPQATGNLSQFVGLAALATPGKPAAITSLGYIQQASSQFNSCTPQTAASYILEFVFDSFALGCPYYVWNALIDNVSGGGKSATGLFDDTGAPRLTAAAIKTLFSLLGDTGGTFTPGKLNYTLSNFPPIVNNVGGRHLLMQKSDGSFWLALWNEQVLNNTSTGADIAVSPITITLTIGETVSSVTVYDPSVSSAVVQNATSVSTLAISLPARVILVKIVK